MTAEALKQKKSRSGEYDLRNDFVCLRFLASTESGCSFHGAHTRILFKGTPLIPRGRCQFCNQILRSAYVLFFSMNTVPCQKGFSLFPVMK